MQHAALLVKRASPKKTGTRKTGKTGKNCHPKRLELERIVTQKDWN
jgi:hypothetical protein